MRDSSRPAHTQQCYISSTQHQLAGSRSPYPHQLSRAAASAQQAPAMMSAADEFTGFKLPSALLPSKHPQRVAEPC